MEFIINGMPKMFILEFVSAAAFSFISKFGWDANSPYNALPFDGYILDANKYTVNDFRKDNYKLLREERTYRWEFDNTNEEKIFLKILKRNVRNYYIIGISNELFGWVAAGDVQKKYCAKEAFDKMKKDDERAPDDLFPGRSFSSNAIVISYN
jgi:hypothetical protein